MKLLLFTLLIGFQTYSQQITLNDLRNAYTEAVNNKELCEKIINGLSKENLSVTEKGYYGAYMAIWAIHVWNPLDKLSTFKKGKKELENALKQEQNNIELHFLRLSIQTNIPTILNYKQNIAFDLAFLKENKEEIKSKKLLSMANELIKKVENN